MEQPQGAVCGTKWSLLGCVNTCRFGLMNCLKSFSFTRHGVTHPDRRLNIVAKGSGRFGIIEQYFYRTEYEDGSVIAEGWASLPGHSIFADVELAEREITAILQGAESGS